MSRLLTILQMGPILQPKNGKPFSFYLPPLSSFGIKTWATIFECPYSLTRQKSNLCKYFQGYSELL